MLKRVEVIRFWRKLNMADPSQIVNVVNIWSLKIHKSREKTVINLIHTLDLPSIDLFHIALRDFYDIKNSLIAVDNDIWLRGLWNDTDQINGTKLRKFRLSKTTVEVLTYVRSITYRYYRSVLATLRCGTLPLEIELGRFSRP